MYESSACLFGRRKNNECRAYIEITNACNMHCKHCMNNSGEPLMQELKKEQMIDLLTELHEQNISQLYIYLEVSRFSIMESMKFYIVLLH